jgi:tetratricopeptide (TPR) repeat protein
MMKSLLAQVAWLVPFLAFVSEANGQGTVHGGNAKAADLARECADLARRSIQAMKDRDEAIEAAQEAKQRLEDVTRDRDAARIKVEQVRQQAAKELGDERKRAHLEVERARQELATLRGKADNDARELEGAREIIAQHRAAEKVSREAAAGLFATGLDEFRRNDLPAAIRSFGKAIETHPNDARFFLMRAVARHQLSREGTALTDAEEDAKRGTAIEQSDPGSGPAIQRTLERVQGKTREWLETFRRQAAERPASKPQRLPVSRKGKLFSF